LEQATQIATRRSTKGLFKDRNKVNKRISSAGTDPIRAKKMLLKEIVDPGSVTFTRAEDLELIGKYFDESPWDEFFLANQEATKREAFKMLQSYDKKIIDLKKL
jgi:hypothetical protein